MSKRNSILIILISIIIIIGGLIYFYFSIGNTPVQNPQNITPVQGNIFGSPSNITNVISSTTGEQNGSVIPTKNLAKLIQIYNNPTSGSSFSVNKNKLNILRFVSRGNGNVYEYIPESETGTPIRITNTTIPKIQETVWSSSTDSIIFRYLNSDSDNIVSFLGKITTGSGTSSILGNTGEVTGVFLTPNIQELVVNPKGDKVFGLLEKSDGLGSYGMTYSLVDSGKAQVFDSPISLWQISWPKDNIITFTTKPSFNDLGYLFFFNTQTKTFDKIIGDIPGMTTLANPDATLVAYTESQNGSFNLFVRDIKSKSDKDFKIQTTADKCVWGKKNTNILYCAVPKNIPFGSYPDDWYQGLVFFSDDIWRVDFNTGLIEQIYQVGSNENATVDAVNLKISNDDQFLSFSNKTDLSLWLLKIQ